MHSATWEEFLYKRHICTRIQYQIQCLSPAQWPILWRHQPPRTKRRRFYLGQQLSAGQPVLKIYWDMICHYTWNWRHEFKHQSLIISRKMNARYWLAPSMGRLSNDNSPSFNGGQPLLMVMCSTDSLVNNLYTSELYCIAIRHQVPRKRDDFTFVFGK